MGIRFPFEKPLLATLVLLPIACGDDGGSGGETNCVTLADGRCVEETFRNPAVLAPDGEGVYELELTPTELTVEGKRYCGRGYNGLYPAPTIDTAANAGAPRSVRVNLRNRFVHSDYQPLGSEECFCVDSATGSLCEPMGHHGGDTCECTTAEGAACHVFDFNTTNLHAHGSHVRPDYASGGGCTEQDGLRCRSCQGDASSGTRECFFADDVISRVGPGEGTQHRWDIDEDGVHHAGLNWYHPHIHGSTAIQVASGATGAWIVRGALDEIPGVKNAKERVMVLTTPSIGFRALAEDEACDEDHITINEFDVLADPASKQTNLVNGIRRPRLVMPPGQIERWRILHGSFLDEMTLALFHGRDADCRDIDLTRPPISLTQIGRDGVPLAKPASGQDWPFAPPYIFLSPGYRIEALLDGGSLGHGDTLCLMAGRFLQADTTGTTGEAVGLMETPTPEDMLQAASNGDLVAIVNVTNGAGTPTETTMPDLAVVAAESPSMMLQGGTLDALARCEEVKAVVDPRALEQLSFMWPLFVENEGYDDCACHDHNLNCKNFENTDREKYPYDRVLRLGDVDHWRLASGFDGHPFHIHTNPFIVCPQPPEGSPDPNAKSRIFEPPFAHWRDTYLVNLDRKIDILAEYRAFTGAYVYHCHKLNHEDHGMMELLRVCDPATEPCETLCDGRPCAWDECAPGDDNCVRQLQSTLCLLDPSQCAELPIRCAACDAEQSCPAAAHCSEVVHDDGLQRCVPGCLADTDCPITDACGGDGTCGPAPCPSPCAPPATCQHGACM